MKCKFCDKEGMLFEEMPEWELYMCKYHTLIGISNHACEKEAFISDMAFIDKRWEGICIGCRDKVPNGLIICENCLTTPIKIILQYRGLKTLKQYEMWHRIGRTNIYENI